MAYEHITERGVTIRLKAVSALLNSNIESALAREGYAKPPWPTKKIPTAGGDVMERSLPEERPEIEQGWEQSDVDAWDEYHKAIAAWETEFSLRSGKAHLFQGVELDDYDPNGSWVDEDNAVGLSVPDNLAERKLLYIETRVFGSVHDVHEVLSAIRLLTLGLSEKEVEDSIAASRIFRAEAQKAGKDSKSVGPAIWQE